MDFGYILIIGGIIFIMYTTVRSSKDKNAQIFDAFDVSRGIGGSSSRVDSMNPDKNT